MKFFRFNILAFVVLCSLLATNLQAQRNSGAGGGTTNTNTGTRQIGDGNNKSSGSTQQKVPAKNKSGTSTTGNKSTTNQTNGITNQKPNNSKGKLFWGGGVNTTTDGKNVIIDAQPFIGYRLSPKMQVTAGPVYQYQSGNNMSIYGARASSRYDIVAGAFAAGMFEYMNYNQNEQNHSLVRMPLGLGYNHSLFGVGANVSVMYDVLHSLNTNSPYATPFIISGGITLGGGGNGFNFGSKNFNINDVFNGSPANINKKTTNNNKTGTNTNNKTQTDGKNRVPNKKKN